MNVIKISKDVKENNQKTHSAYVQGAGGNGG
jgi:hypothetical protein